MNQKEVGIWMRAGGVATTAAGVGLIGEHKIAYGRVYDAKKDFCHGKLGLVLTIIGPILAIIGHALANSD